MTEPRVLNATGLRCPLPVLRARKALASVPAGGTLEVLADDPAATKDMPAFCSEMGYALTVFDVATGGWRFVIEKPGA